MKKYMIMTLMIFGFAAGSQAAICSCDAPPECGSKPFSCHLDSALLLQRTTYVEAHSSAPKTLRILNFLSVSSDVLAVNYGSPLDGKPFGDHFIEVTSDFSFDLMLKPFSGQAPQFIDTFHFVESPHSHQIEEIRSSKGTVFVLDPGP